MLLNKDTPSIFVIREYKKSLLKERCYIKSFRAKGLQKVIHVHN